MTLRDALTEAARALPGAVERSSEALTEWLVGDVAFAAVREGTAEFRLSPAVARAARGTPDTAAAPRGRDWVAFTPSTLDRFALDRATAWFASAHRHASERAD